MIRIQKVIFPISIVIFCIVILFSWNYLVSVYEVKFINHFDPTNLKINTEYKIECIAINSFGWKLAFRNLGINCKIIKGSDIVKVLNSQEANFLKFKLIGQGEIVLEFNSKFALNPTRFEFFIPEEKSEN